MHPQAQQISDFLKTALPALHLKRCPWKGLEVSDRKDRIHVRFRLDAECAMLTPEGLKKSVAIDTKFQAFPWSDERAAEMRKLIRSDGVQDRVHTMLQQFVERFSGQPGWEMSMRIPVTFSNGFGSCMGPAFLGAMD